MGYTGAEPIIDLILTELKANLPAKLTALAAVLMPSLPLPAPAVSEYTFSERQMHTTYPAIEIFPVSTPIEMDSTETAVYRHSIGVVISVRHANIETLERLRLRYLRAVHEVLADRRAAQAFGSVGIDFNGQTIDWMPSRVAERALLQQDVMFLVRASKSESRT